LKRSRVIAVFIVALMLLASTPVRVAHGQGGYTEKLNVFVAGSDALWYFTFGGINGSSSLSTLESTPGLSWYNVTAIDTTGWQSDYQVFGPEGYNLLPVPFIPPEGLFLKVGSDSFNDASAAASALDSYLLTGFVSLSNGTGAYTFYSSLSFDALVPLTLLKFLPTSEQGFTSAITKSGLVSTDSPFVVLEGQKSSSGFSHSLVVGSISASALTATGAVNILGYYGTTITFLQASNQSSSSVIRFQTLDGVLKSADKASVSTDYARFTGSYTLNLAAGKRLTGLNATVVEQPGTLLATRAVDVGVLRTGDDIAITLSLRNTSPSYPISKITYTDSWWNSTGLFKFLGGNDSIPGSGLVAGASVTPVYRLQYTGTSIGNLTIPASVIRYAYVVRGVSFNGTAVFNPIRLSLGRDDAVVYSTLVPVGGLGSPVGEQQRYNVTVTNVGTLPASSVVVAGHSIAGLAARSGGSPGGTATVVVTQNAKGLLGTNTTQSYLTTYQDPAGTSLSATTNLISFAFSHSSMKIGFSVLTVSDTVGHPSTLETNLTLSFTTTNGGKTNVTSFVATGALPAGLGCGTIKGKGLTCASGLVTLSYPVINESTTETATMGYNLTSPLNYVMAPLDFQGTTSGSTVTGKSNGIAIPAGLRLSKVFTPAQLFGGMSSVVKLSATNTGPLQIYNVTVSSKVDYFDTLSSSAALSKISASIGAGGNFSLSYGVTASRTYGNLTGTPATASFYFGGTSFTINGAAPTVEVYQPLTISISTTPAKTEEGKNFTMSFVIKNPSGVQVSDVRFVLPFPSGVGLSDLRNAQVASGVLTIAIGTLAPHSTATASASAVASSGITIPFDKAKLTFSYSGITVNGTVPSGSGIAIGEDITTRYLIPTALVLLVLVLTAFYVRRKAAPTVPASPK
jgi:hypothetical protein